MLNCEYCNKEFVNRSGLYKHLIKKHPVIDGKVKYDITNPLKCKYCDKILACKESKYKH